MSCEFGKLSIVKMSALACAHSLWWFTRIPLFLPKSFIIHFPFIILMLSVLYDLLLMIFSFFISRLTKIIQGKGETV